MRTFAKVIGIMGIAVLVVSAAGILHLLIIANY